MYATQNPPSDDIEDMGGLGAAWMYCFKCKHPTCDKAGGTSEALAPCGCGNGTMELKVSGRGILIRCSSSGVRGSLCAALLTHPSSSHPPPLPPLCRRPLQCRHAIYFPRVRLLTVVTRTAHDSLLTVHSLFLVFRQLCLASW